MCGIYAHFHNSNPRRSTHWIRSLKHRGPDGTVIVQLPKITLGFTHLQINGSQSQPLTTGNWWILCNGEIFNHVKLENDMELAPPPNSSDCWILPYLFDAFGFNHVCQQLDGEFAMIAYNSLTNTLYAYRDPFGVRPLYIGKSYRGIVVASEMKVMKNCKNVWHVLPGACTSISSDNSISTMKYYIPTIEKKISTDFEMATTMVRQTLIDAVKKRCMSDRPVGALLSGGLDSSIICSILANQCLRDKSQLKTFSIGMEGSTDLLHARIMSKFLNSDHHEIVVTSDDFMEAIDSVIYSIESYDTTTVRASVGNWLVGRYISNHSDCKVIFNGDGSDELFGGYLYFHKAPDDSEFEKETARLLSEIHMFDVLRSDRCMAAHGLETRTPFLDIDLVSLIHKLPTQYLRPSSTQQEKFILREAFKEFLPDAIYSRRKEAFSDGVNESNTSWFSDIVDEKRYYYETFNKYYPDRVPIPHYWMPSWSPEATDPSARTLNIYKN